VELASAQFCAASMALNMFEATMNTSAMQGRYLAVLVAVMAGVLGVLGSIHVLLQRTYYNSRGSVFSS